jgi:hypothetical protein
MKTLPALIDRFCDGVPLIRNVFVSQIVIIPTLAGAAFKTAILAGFLLRQSYQRSGIAIGKETAPVDLN